jgi:hypothetical protein
MIQQFKNMNELVEYLGTIEGRIKFLEEENHRLRSAPALASANSVDERTIAKYVATSLPLTDIVHPSFLKRAFAVWGHYFVAQLIISIPLMIIYFCLLASIFNSSLQSP